MSKIIMGVELCKRRETSPKFQKLLSEYGCVINTRLGLHRASGDLCSENGIILLEFLEGADDKVAEFEAKLKKLDGVKMQKMVF